MAAAAIAARERLGLGSGDISNLLKKASDEAHQATRSLQSAAGGSPTPETATEYVESVKDSVLQGAEDVYEKAESIYSDLSGDSYASSISSSAASYATEASSIAHGATRSIQSAVGGSPTPESAGEYLEAAVDDASSLASQATGSAADIYSSVVEAGASGLEDASSLLHEGTRSAASLAGATPSPESSEEYVEFYIGDASNRVADLQSAAQAALSSASSFVSEPASQVYEAAETAASHLNSLTDSASTTIHQATNSIKSAVGASPDLEGVGEFAEQKVKEVKQGQSEVYSAASSSVKSATRSLKKEAGETPMPTNLEELVGDVRDYAEEQIEEIKEAADGAVKMGRRVVDEL